MTAVPVPMHAELFCRVIDNYGDAGVCWRLARQLAETHGLSVRLWLDCPAVLAPLLPDDTVLHSLAITLQPWQDDLPLPVLQSVAEADLVIEAFACELPAPCLAAMAAASRPPVWLNLEYLSAEDWVAGCHGLCSRHPQTGLDKRFFFPGFNPDTGGLLREKDLLAQRDAFQADVTAQNGFWQQLGLNPPESGQQQVSLFCYDTAPVAPLLDHWAECGASVRCLVTAGQAQAAVSCWLAARGKTAQTHDTGHGSNGCLVHTCGALQFVLLPFLPQTEFDRLLWACDVNFVRGEDSLIRAIWAEKPFVWQIYKQAEDAHFAKLTAFMHCNPALRAPSTAWHSFWLYWNGWPEAILPDWAALANAWPAFQDRQQAWGKTLAAQPDLATRICQLLPSPGSSRSG